MLFHYLKLLMFMSCLIYRPISLCSVVGKILERVVCKHLINHMYRGVIISPTQHRFLPKRSCVTQLTTLYHSWANALHVPKPFRIDAIFLDRVSHQVLLNKLHKIMWCLWFNVGLV